MSQMSFILRCSVGVWVLAAFSSQTRAWIPGTYGPVTRNYVAGMLATANDHVLIAGDYPITDERGQLASGIARFSRSLVPNTLEDPTFRPAVNGTVTELRVLADGRILIAGFFATIQKTASPGIGRLNPDGSRDPSFTNPLKNGSYATAVSALPNGKILIGGALAVNGIPGGSGVLRLNTDGSVDPSFTPLKVSGGMNALFPLSDGSFLLGGVQLTEPVVGGASLLHIFSSGQVDPGFAPNVKGQIWRIVALPNQKILIGGSFNGIGTNTHAGLARFNSDLTLDTEYRKDIPGEVRSVVRGDDDTVVVGGAFTTVGGKAMPGMARLKADGSLDDSFNPVAIPRSTTGNVTAVAPQADGRIIVAGAFKSVSGFPVENIFRLNHDGSLDIRPYPQRWQSLGHGQFQFSLTNMPASQVTVVGSSDPLAADAAWTLVGPATQVSNHVYQVTDPEAEGHSPKYYRVEVE